ncbi:MAG: hypothetical protein R2837_06580 [Aliarcobacter sp.]
MLDFLSLIFITLKKLYTSKYEAIDYKTQNELFVKECASCHTLYPSVLPKNHGN